MLASLRLFKAVPITDDMAYAFSAELNARTVPMGYVFSPTVQGNRDAEDIEDLIAEIERLYGKDPEKLNKSFHKSFSTVRDSSQQELYYQQLTHYVTTYGFQSLGTYDPRFIYVPPEAVEAPEITGNTRLVVIRGMTHRQMRKALLDLLNSGVALSEETLADVTTIADYAKIAEHDLANVRNYEARVRLYDYLEIFPTIPSEFVRYALYKSTGSTLLIKNPETIEAIKAGSDPTELFDSYAKSQGLDRLSSVFFRYKPLFLAWRSHQGMRPIVNRMRRLADSNHKPMDRDYLNEITALAKRNTLNNARLTEELRDASGFRKARLFNALAYRIDPAGSIVYRVRNGKAWATSFDSKPTPQLAQAFAITLESLASTIVENLEGRSVYLQENLFYGLPSSEKQFIGNVPAGSYVELDGPMVAGIYWEDVEGRTVDLDLSLTTADGKIGWDTAYRDDGKSIYFSGDITAAPHGATEAFWLGTNAIGAWTLNVNYFNARANLGIDVPFKIFIASSDEEGINRNYTLDVNNVVAMSESSIGAGQNQLGIVIGDGTKRRFYFSEASVGMGRTAALTPAAEHARSYLIRSMTNAISLSEIIIGSGAVIVDDPRKADLDLSFENIDKTTLIQLLS